MNILAIDTASDWGSLVLRSQGRVLSERHCHSTVGFAHLLFPLIAELLDAASMTLQDIDCFAAGSGPGSFTGVRVALSIAKGLAEANHKPALGVSNLRALATQSQAVRRAALLDARRGDVYAAVYDPELEAIAPEVVTKLGPWLELLESAEYEFVALPGAPFLAELGQSRFGEMPVLPPAQTFASSIALCAELDGLAGRWSDPALLDANYVRRSDAELFWREA